MTVRNLQLAAFAVTGVILGHLFAYIFAWPNPDARAHALEHTGHGWLTYGTVIAVIAGIGAAAGAFAAGWRGTARHINIRQLYLTMLAGWFTVETIERLAHGHTISQTLHELAAPHMLAAGIAGIGIAAAGIAALWHGAHHIGDALNQTAAPPPAPANQPEPAPHHIVVDNQATGAVPGRGPPALASR